MKYAPIKERTFVLVKPDGVARGLTGEILSRFERKGLAIVAVRMVVADEKLAAKHYEEHKGNDEYFDLMKNAVLGGPCLAVILEGEVAIQAARQLIGNANPFQSQVGTIRGDFATKMGENLIHGADSQSAAEREIGLWFTDAPKMEQPAPVVLTGNANWGPPKKKVAKSVTPQKFNWPSETDLNAWSDDFDNFTTIIGMPLTANGPVSMNFSKTKKKVLADPTSLVFEDAIKWLDKDGISYEPLTPQTYPISELGNLHPTMKIVKDPNVPSGQIHIYQHQPNSAYVNPETVDEVFPPLKFADYYDQILKTPGDLKWVSTAKLALDSNKV